MYKVFIVDDEPFIIEGLYDILDWSSFDMEIVSHAGNGQAALNALSAQPVDILITDISMPFMNGLDLIREARQLQPDIKVIILSGFNEFEYLKEGMQLGIENYLLKPINVEELESTLRNTASKLDHALSPQTDDAYGVQILKDNILHRWLTGQIAAAEFEERAQFLNLSLDAPDVAVAILRTKGEVSGMFERVEGMLKEKSYVNVFHDIDGDIVIVANVHAGEDEKKKFMECLQALSAALCETHPAVLIGAGSLMRGLHHAPASYQEAKKALQYVMIYPDLKVIDHALLEKGEAPPLPSRSIGRSTRSLFYPVMQSCLRSEFGSILNSSATGLLRLSCRTSHWKWSFASRWNWRASNIRMNRLFTNVDFALYWTVERLMNLFRRCSRWGQRRYSLCFRI